MATGQEGKHTILDRLSAGEVLISDGATGTYLQQRGLEPGGCPEEFNASHPDVVRGMARDYFAAGSDIVLTNSFGGSRFMQKKYGYAGRVEEFNRLAAEHAASQKPSDRPLCRGVSWSHRRDDGTSSGRRERVGDVRRTCRTDYCTG